MNKPVTITLRLPADWLAQLDAQVEQTGIPRQVLIRSAIREQLLDDTASKPGRPGRPLSLEGGDD